MRVLWLCNRALCAEDAGATGTWLDAMARGLLDSGSVELGIIAPGPVRQFSRRDYCQVKQWIMPDRSPLGRNGLPPDSVVQAIVAIATEFAPSLIHIWGTENFWGLLPARGLLTHPALLEIQGFKGQYAKVFFGALTLRERLCCTGIKELLKRRTMHADRRDFARWGLREEEMIRGYRFVDAQSPWVCSHIKAINPAARLFPVDLPLRQPFYNADAWQPPGRPTLFCSTAYPAPYKGLHVAIRALSLLKKRIPDARLRIAGAHQSVGIRQNGYMRWVNRMIQQLDLATDVDWLGPLNAEQVVTELKNAAVAVLPSFAETYCVAFAEGMRVGTPTVVSYTGGTAYLGRDEESCLFFPPGDDVMCAYQLERVLRNRKLAVRLSQQARAVAAIRNDRQQIVQRQLDIYQQVLQAG